MLFSGILERYPELKDHPNLHRVVDGFSRFMQLAESTAKDESLAVVLEKQRRDVENDMPGPEQLEPQQVEKPTDLSKADHREACLRGAEKHQPDTEKAVTDSESHVPDVYKRLMGKTGGATAHADKGNVFS